MEGGLEKNDTYQLSFYHTITKNNKSVIGVEKSTVNIRNNEWIINHRNEERSQLVYDDVSKNIDISILGKGVYMLNVRGNKREVLKRVVVY